MIENLEVIYIYWIFHFASVAHFDENAILILGARILYPEFHARLGIPLCGPVFRHCQESWHKY